MYVCICYAVTEDDLRAEIDAGARTEDDVADRCGAGSGCGSCQERICAVLALSRGDAAGAPSSDTRTRGRIPVAV